jgi:hypothetical protein
MGGHQVKKMNSDFLIINYEGIPQTGVIANRIQNSQCKLRLFRVRSRVIRGTSGGPLPLLSSEPGGICGTKLHEARNLSTSHFEDGGNCNEITGCCLGERGAEVINFEPLHITPTWQIKNLPGPDVRTHLYFTLRKYCMVSYNLFFPAFFPLQLPYAD